MDEETIDVNTEESSTTEQESAEDSTQAKTVPYARLKAETERRKELEAKLSVLEKLEKAFTNEEEVTEKPVGPDPNSRVDELEETLLLKDKGYSTEEILAMRRYAKGDGKKTIEVENDPFIKGVIANMRNKQEVEQTTPSPSTPTPTPNVGGAESVRFDESGKVVKTAPTSFADWQAAQAKKGRTE